jgi:hypothetical protein
MSQIFISYASEDRKHAERLAHALETHGWSVWWDRSIPAGRSFDEVIETALQNAACVLVLWSARSIRSQWVSAEAQEGADRGILVPVLIEDAVRPPLGFRRIQMANLVGWEGSPEDHSFQALVRDLERVLGGPEAAPSRSDSSPPAAARADPPVPPPQRRLRPAVLALLTLAVIPAGYFAFTWGRSELYERKLRSELARIQEAQERHYRQYGVFTHLLQDSLAHGVGPDGPDSAYVLLIPGLDVEPFTPGFTAQVWATDSGWSASVLGEWTRPDKWRRKGCVIWSGPQEGEIAAIPENVISCYPVRESGLLELPF